MIAAPKQKGLDYSIYKKKIDKKTVRILSSSVIYGANASGKTNIIGAMDVLRSIILRGHIRNTEEPVISPNTAAYLLELIPNSKLKMAEPVVFEISFLDKNRKIDYHLSIDLGTFLNEKHKRKIVSEELYVDNRMIFSRNDGIKYGLLNRYIPDVSSKNLDGLKVVADNSLEPTELFLTNGFKNIFSPSLAKQIVEWFDKKFMVIYRADSIKLIKRFVDPQKSSMYVERTVNEAAKMFGVVSNDLGYFVSDKDSDASLCSVIENNLNSNTLIPAEIFESYGTIRFVNMFPLVISALQTGATLIVDEFDASIHPMALMNIINIFHNDDINKNHAQLIFNTHNPIFLNSNLFRRDEIKFVERNDDTSYSEIYALSDFGTSAEKGVRKREDYMKNYFVCKYGAIKDIDFSPLFENISGEQEV
jgi:hypothetical protein